jgi:hypothetical protein
MAGKLAPIVSVSIHPYSARLQGEALTADCAPKNIVGGELCQKSDRPQLSIGHYLGKYCT